MKTILILGAEWQIVEASDLEETGNEGECLPDEAKIKIKSGSAARQWSKLRHEIGHAVAFESGFVDRLVQEFGVSLDTAREIEEAVMGHFVPVYCDTLERAGLLRAPATPKAKS